MLKPANHFRPFLGLKLACLSAPMLVSLCGLAVLAVPAPPVEEPAASLTLGDAIRYGLEHNPELMATRQQHGIAAAGVVIARTYPFNPVLENRVRAAFGPPSAGVTNSVEQEYLLLTEIECRGQGQYRREAAAAGLSRTDWEIANQEVTLAVRVTRAFDGVVYRFQKRLLTQQNVELNERAARQVQELVNTGAPRPADLIIIRTEIQDAQAQLNLGRLALTTAYADLRRALGVVNERFQLNGDLSLPVVPENPAALMQAALERRADLRNPPRGRAGDSGSPGARSCQSLRQHQRWPLVHLRSYSGQHNRRAGQPAAAAHEHTPGRDHAARVRVGSGRIERSPVGNRGSTGRSGCAGAPGTGAGSGEQLPHTDRA